MAFHPFGTLNMPSLSIPKLTFELPRRSGPDVVGLDIQPGLVAEPSRAAASNSTESHPHAGEVTSTLAALVRARRSRERFIRRLA